MGNYVQGVASYWQGHLARARQILTRAIDSYDLDQQDEHLALYSQDPRVVCLSRLAVVLWSLGYPDQAAQTSQEALALARKLAHPNTLGYVLTWTSWLYHLSSDTKATLKHTDEAIAFCDQEHLVFWLPQNFIFKGWAHIRQNETEKGLSLLEQGLAGYEAANAKHTVPYFRALAAAAAANAGEFKKTFRIFSISSIWLRKVVNSGAYQRCTSCVVNYCWLGAQI